MCAPRPDLPEASAFPHPLASRSVPEPLAGKAPGALRDTEQVTLLSPPSSSSQLYDVTEPSCTWKALLQAFIWPGFTPNPKNKEEPPMSRRKAERQGPDTELGTKHVRSWPLAGGGSSKSAPRVWTRDKGQQKAKQALRKKEKEEKKHESLLLPALPGRSPWNRQRLLWAARTECFQPR